LKNFTPFLLLTMAAGAGLLSATPADARDMALARLAAQDGLAYDYVGATDEVLLQGTNLTISIRPGERLIQVNGRNETVDAAPHFYKRDLYVSSETANRIAALAAAVPRQNSMRARASDGMTMRSVPVYGPASGPVSISATQVPGQPKLAVRGTAPAGSSLTLTLQESITKEVPDIVVSRQAVQAGPDGRFTAAMPIAPAFFGGALLKVIAVTASGETTSAPITLKRFNEDATIEADQLPKGVR